MIKFTKILAFLLLMTLVVPISSQPANAGGSINCAVLKRMTANLFNPSPSPSPNAKNIWIEAGKAFNKAMDLAFANQGCYKKSEIAGMKKALKELKLHCMNAKKDDLTWSLLKGMCSAYEPSFKYAK